MSDPMTDTEQGDCQPGCTVHQTCRERDFDRSVSTQNRRGEWVPAIPMPFFGLRKRCSCGAKFWTLVGYEGHYARDHILGKG